MNMKRSIAAGALLLGSAVGVLSLVAAPPLGAQSVSARVAAERTATFAIENMTCALCPVTVRKAMEGVAGVRSVAIDFDAKTATVVFDPSVTSLGAIAAASTNAGYPAAAKS